MTTAPEQRDRSPTASIDIFGDCHGDLDAGYGTNMILRGRIVADCVVAKAPASGDPVGHVHAVDGEPARPTLTQIWGNNDVDTFQLGDPSGSTGGEIRARHHDLGERRLHLPRLEDDVVRLSRRRRRPPPRRPQPLRGGDPRRRGRFIVWFLQSMNVVRRDPANGLGAGHTLTLDGQADTDYYTSTRPAATARRATT